MSNDHIKVLLVEDSAADARLLRKFLATVTHVELSHVECLSAALSRLRENDFDAILLDLSLPDSRGINTVKQVHNLAPKSPILVLTGLDDEETAIAALREGAQDYLVKGEIQRTWLVRAIHYAIERQQNLDKLQQLNDELSRSNRELEQFTYVVSHDLRQPLQGILGFSQILALTYQTESDERIKHYIDRIINSSRHMAQLIKDLLEYSTIGKSDRPRQPTDCNRIVAQVLSDLQLSIKDTAAVITTDVLPTVCANETQLVQLFQNLISNALKYHLPTQAPQVKVSVEHQEQEWLFGVHDNGIGIQAEHYDQIFQIFQRLHTKDEYPGTGIGLATCKNIVERHGGRIWVDSAAGVGTTFYFTLPA
jgi:signal transduction histidine kinase